MAQFCYLRLFLGIEAVSCYGKDEKVEKFALINVNFFQGLKGFDLKRSSYTIITIVVKMRRFQGTNRKDPLIPKNLRGPRNVL